MSTFLREEDQYVILEFNVEYTGDNGLKWSFDENEMSKLTDVAIKIIVAIVFRGSVRAAQDYEDKERRAR